MTVHATGEIDLATAPDLRARLCAEIEQHPGEQVVVDLSGVTFIDSCGLGVLVGALKRARQSGGDLSVTQPSPKIWKVFTVTGLNKVFRLVDSPAEAIPA